MHMKFPLLLAFTLSSATAAHAQGRAPRPADLVTVDVATVGIGIATGAPVVVLHDPVSDKALPVWVGTAEAEAIARALFGIAMPRPMTHDLLDRAIRDLGAAVYEVRVTDVRDGVYYGSIHLRTRSRDSVEVDSRPSDAVALALRADAPIRVTRRLLDEAPEIEIAPRDSVPEIARALGLTVVLPTPELQEAFGLPRRDGVVVVQITARGAGLGLQRGDLIIEVNGMVPKTPLAFFEAMRGGGRATSALVKYWRGGAEREVRIPLPAQAPDEDTRTRVEVD